MSRLLEELDGVVCHMDDILVFGRNQDEHDNRIRKVLGRIQKAGITLNKEKCMFSVTSLKLLGQIVGNGVIRPDPEKGKAILEMSPPPTFQK